ncbi:MAG TPA: hypothetical protein VE962_01115 [Actinomycetota bacterium]|nr:hypothetical protein [Actinomycetota bacterium]
MPLRTVGFGAAAGGALLTILAGFHGPAALVGLVALCVGIALLDAVDIGRVGRRQIALFLVSFGGVVGMWGLVVTILLVMLGLPAQPTVLMLLAGGILALGAALYLIRYAPVPKVEPAPVARRRRSPSRRSSTRRRRRSRAPELEELRRLAG